MTTYSVDTDDKMLFWLPEVDGFEFEGYFVDSDDNASFPWCFPAFEMDECERLAKRFAELVDEFDDGTPEQFPLLSFNAETGCWEEHYYDGLYAEYEPMVFNGVTMYCIGAGEFGWEC